MIHFKYYVKKYLYIPSITHNVFVQNVSDFGSLRQYAIATCIFLDQKPTQDELLPLSRFDKEYYFSLLHRTKARR